MSKEIDMFQEGTYPQTQDSYQIWSIMYAILLLPPAAAISIRIFMCMISCRKQKSKKPVKLSELAEEVASTLDDVKVSDIFFHKEVEYTQVVVNPLDDSHCAKSKHSYVQIHITNLDKIDIEKIKNNIPEFDLKITDHHYNSFNVDAAAYDPGPPDYDYDPIRAAEAAALEAYLVSQQSPTNFNFNKRIETAFTIKDQKISKKDTEYHAYKLQGIDIYTFNWTVRDIITREDLVKRAVSEYFKNVVSSCSDFKDVDVRISKCPEARETRVILVEYVSRSEYWCKRIELFYNALRGNDGIRLF